VFKDHRDYAGALGFMNWTSTQHNEWADQCREFASNRQPFRLEHVYGKDEESFCDHLCEQQNYRQERHGAFVVFTPIPIPPDR
jgi:hypothetical protein